ncbi:MAG: sensor histidine kinase [Acidimicrobiales bacterium]
MQDVDELEVVLHEQKLAVIGQLASGVAHEINTPMQYIGDNLGFVDDALAVLCDPEVAASTDPDELAFLRTELPEAIRQARRGVDRVNEIVKAMKAFGHRDEARQQYSDLDGLVRQALVVVRNETKYVADVHTALTLDRPVACFPGDLGQVIVNLVVNAAHAIADHGPTCGERGTISVRSWRDVDTAVIEIEDDGGGIPTDVRDRVFEPFFTTKEVGRGTGQGLPISRSVVEGRHGGTLAFRVLDGVGTIFRIELPVEGVGDVA